MGFGFWVLGLGPFEYFRVDLGMGLRLGRGYLPYVYSMYSMSVYVYCVQYVHGTSPGEISKREHPKRTAILAESASPPPQTARLASAGAISTRTELA